MGEIINYIFGQSIYDINRDILIKESLYKLVVFENKWRPNDELYINFDTVDKNVSMLKNINYKLKEAEQKLILYINQKELILKKSKNTSGILELQYIEQEISDKKSEITKHKNFINKYENNEKCNSIINNYRIYINNSEKFIIENNLQNFLKPSDIITSQKLNINLTNVVRDLYYNHDTDSGVNGLIKLNDCFDLSCVEQTIRSGFLIEYKKKLKINFNMFGKNVVNAEFDKDSANINYFGNNIKINKEKDGCSINVNNKYEGGIKFNSSEESDNIDFKFGYVNKNEIIEVD